MIRHRGKEPDLRRESTNRLNAAYVHFGILDEFEVQIEEKGE